VRDFFGKKVYIVGGSSGIGLSTANMLSAEGAHIIIFARTKEVLERSLKEITDHRATDTQQFLCRQMDVSIREEVGAVMSGAVSEFGVPEVLINCAGRAYPHRFDDITYEQFDETMKINLYGTWNTVSALVPYMKNKGGYIVNVSSIAGFIGVFGYTDYSASKFGVIGFSEALRSELKKYGIRVSVLCPPDTDTPGFHVENRTKPEETKAVSGNVKLMQPDKVARALIKGMREGKFIVVPGFDGKLTCMAKRFFPSLVEYVMDRDIKKVHKHRKLQIMNM
jgi:short-subunit dehydrogenase